MTAQARACDLASLHAPLQALDEQITAFRAAVSTGTRPILTSLLTLTFAPLADRETLEWSELKRELLVTFRDGADPDMTKLAPAGLRHLYHSFARCLCSPAEERAIGIWIGSLTQALADSIATQAQTPAIAIAEPEDASTPASEAEVAIQLKPEKFALAARRVVSSPLSSLSPSPELEVIVLPSSTRASEGPERTNLAPSPERKPVGQKRARNDSAEEAELGPPGRSKRLSRALAGSEAEGEADGARGLPDVSRTAQKGSKRAVRANSDDNATPGPSGLNRPPLVLPTASIGDDLTSDDRTGGLRRSSRRRSYAATGLATPEGTPEAQRQPPPRAKAKPWPFPPPRRQLPPAPLVDAVPSDSPWSQLLRRTLRIPSRVLLNNSAPPANFVEQSFTRFQMGGSTMPVVKPGTSGGVYYPDRRQICLKPGMNLVRPHVDPTAANEFHNIIEAGEPIVFTSCDKNIKLAVAAARSENEPNPAAAEINIFIAHSTGKWHYKGTYTVAYVGRTPSGAFVDLDEAQSNIVDGLLGGHLAQAVATAKDPEKADWAPRIEADWQLSINSVESALKYLQTDPNSAIQFVVFTFVRIDTASLDVWRTRLEES